MNSPSACDAVRDNMTNKESTTTKTTVVKTNGKAKKPKNRIKAATNKAIKKLGGVSATRRCLWLESVYTPFSCAPAHIPDERTSSSGLVTSRILRNTSNVTSLSGSSATTHNFGFLVQPHLSAGVYDLWETTGGSGTLTDINAAGTSWVLQTNWANLDAVMGAAGNVAKYRSTAIGVRVTYLGTELQRAGRVVAGLLPIAAAASTVAATGTKLSSFSTSGLTYSATVATITKSLEYMSEARISDGVFEYHWVPSAMPSYQTAAGSTGTTTNLLTTTTSGGNSVVPSFFNGPAGGGNVEGGQYMLMLFVEGDTTATSTANTNAYDIEFIMHGEVIPQSVYSVAYNMSPSPYDVAELQASINALASLPTGHQYTVAGGTPGNTNTPTPVDMSSAANNLSKGMKFAGDVYNNPVVKTMLRSTANGIFPGAGMLLP